MPKFNIGDNVIYGINGACQIIEIGPLSFGGQDKIYYSLKPVIDARSTIYLPVAREDEIKRYVIDKETAIELISKFKDVKPYKGQISREICEPIIKSGDILKIAGLIKNLRTLKIENRKVHKGLNIQEEKLLREAENAVYSEFAISLDMKVEEVISNYSTTLD